MGEDEDREDKDKVDVGDDSQDDENVDNDVADDEDEICNDNSNSHEHKGERACEDGGEQMTRVRKRTRWTPVLLESPMQKVT